MFVCMRVLLRLLYEIKAKLVIYKFVFVVHKTLDYDCLCVYLYMSMYHSNVALDVCRYTECFIVLRLQDEI
jgi:hypothetical protein